MTVVHEECCVSPCTACSTPFEKRFEPCTGEMHHFVLHPDGEPCPLDGEARNDVK